MLKLAALAFLPIAAVTFGALAIILAMQPTHDFDSSAFAYMAAAVTSMLIAIPFAWLAARRMLTRRERQLIDAS